MLRLIRWVNGRGLGVLQNNKENLKSPVTYISSPEISSHIYPVPKSPAPLHHEANISQESYLIFGGNIHRTETERKEDANDQPKGISGSDPGIFKGRVQGPRKGRSVGIFQLTSQKKLFSY